MGIKLFKCETLRKIQAVSIFTRGFGDFKINAAHPAQLIEQLKTIELNDPGIDASLMEVLISKLKDLYNQEIEPLVAAHTKLLKPFEKLDYKSLVKKLRNI